MGATDMTWGNLATLLLLFLPFFWINRWLGLNVNKRAVIGLIRMVLQLGAVGLFLSYLFDYNNAWINISYITVMMVVATFSTIKSCEISLRRFALPVFIGFFIPAILLIMFFNRFIVGIHDIFTAQYLIPVGGMILGNCLTGNVIGLNRFYNGIKEQEKEYLYFLGLSGRKKDAMMPYFRDALKSAINPTLASIETIGLVALPGMMTGQMLGGSVPLTAIKYQMAISASILLARYFSCLFTILLTLPYGFDEYDMLLELNS